MRTTNWAFLVAMAVGVPCPTARACTVPVFRYALERWKPSAYQVRVFHRGAPSDSERRLIQRLEEASPGANLKVTLIDLDGEVTPRQRALWKAVESKAVLPWVVVHFPDEEEDATPVSSGRLDEGYVQSLLDSPTRRRLVDHLGRGDSAVWLLLESGDKRADDAAAAMLESELARLNRELKLSEPDAKDLLSTAVPLKVSFVMARLSRKDDREARLVEMLLAGDEDLAKVTGPIVFPVFGRGRVRLALHGDQLRPTAIERWASSLCGPCSCLLKELNPGFDLLLTASWDDLLGLDGEPAPATTSAPSVVIPPGSVTPERNDPGSESGWLWFAGGAGLLVLMAAGMALRDRRGASGSALP